MDLFQRGDFILHSGRKAAWKIGCDALTDEDIVALAEMVRQVAASFSWVSGVPRGGLRLAKALELFVSSDAVGGLIVDDVLTTGGSMAHHRAALLPRSQGARGPSGGHGSAGDTASD